MLNPWVRNGIILIVAVVWGANFIAPIFVKGYSPAPELNVAFMAIIGALTQIKTREPKAPRRHSDDTEEL